jgi:hypothetical protein
VRYAAGRASSNNHMQRSAVCTSQMDFTGRLAHIPAPADVVVRRAIC